MKRLGKALARYTLRRAAFIAGFALSISLLGLQSANAVFITERADVALVEVDTSITPLTQADTITLEQGIVYTNTVSRVSGSNATPSIGDQVRSVFAAPVFSVLNGAVYTPVRFIDSSGVAHQVVIVGATEGTIVQMNGPISVLDITAARSAMVAVPEGSFEIRDPKTWGLTNANAGTVLAEWKLKPREDIQQGLGQQVGLVPAATVNLSAVNAALASNATDGTLLVREDTGNSGFPGILHPQAPGDGMITTVTNSSGLPVFDEGLFTTLNQNLERFDLTAATFPGDIPRMGLTGTIDGLGNEQPPILPQGIGGPELSVMNFLAQYAGLSGNFASGISVSGAVSDFTPAYNAAGVNTTGDFRARIEVLNAHMGLQPQLPASLGDRVWEDLNGDGIQNCSTPTGDVIGDGDDGCTEPGIEGVEVRLLDSGVDGTCGTGDENLLALTVTDAQGFYLFSNLTPGQYCVAVVEPAGFECTVDNQGADDALDSDVVDQGDGTCQTEDPVQNPIDLAAGETDLTWDAGLVQPAELGDFVWNDLDRDGIQDTGEPGIPGVEVRLLQCVGGVPNGQLQTTTTDANGLYLFDNLTPGEYAIVFVAPTGFQFSPANQGVDDALDSDAVNIIGNLGETACVTLQSGETNLTVDGGLFATAGLGDRVWEDSDADGIQDPGEPGIPEVTVNLLLPGNDGICNTGDEVAAGTTTTDETGIYAFNDLNPGRYCVEFVKPDICDAEIGGASSFSPADQGADDTLDSDADTVTGQTGNIDLDPNEFDSTNDAGVFCPAKLGDRVWNDLDEDGIQDGGEPGIPGVTVNLFDCGPDGLLGTPDDGGPAGTTTTDANGIYMFNPLAPGNYAVGFVAPAGFLFSPQDQGADDTIDSDADPVTGETACTNLESNENDPTLDAGLFEPQQPDINIEKATNGVDADDPNAGDAPQVAIGDTVSWNYRVTNTGNVILINVTVVDDQGVTVSCPQDTLAPGEFMDCTASAPAEDLTATTFTTVPGLCGGVPNSPLYENRGTATGETVTGTFVEDVDPSHYCNPPADGGQGCTPGFWKQSQHFAAWFNPPYAPDTPFSDVFENAFPGMTLLGVLSQGGGGVKALGRHTVAALLNAATADVSYDIATPAEVIAAFNDVFPGNRGNYNGLKNVFEGFNEQGCPINGKSPPSNLP